MTGSHFAAHLRHLEGASSLYRQPPDPGRHAAQIDPDSITQREALALLYELKKAL